MMAATMSLEGRLSELTNKMYKKTVKECTDAQLYNCVLQLTKEQMAEKPVISGKKKVYYISMEFLIGKLLSNNLINLGIYDQLDELLKKNGRSLAAIEEAEPEPSLGNGGLGRLAACFLDSIATLGLPGDGIMGCLSRYLKSTCKRRRKTTGSKKIPGLRTRESALRLPLGTGK